MKYLQKIITIVVGISLPSSISATTPISTKTDTVTLPKKYQLATLNTLIKHALPREFFDYFPAHEPVLTLPNIITLSRLILAVLITDSMKHHQEVKATLLITLSFISDLLDGKLAHLLNQETTLGNVLDAFADKATIAAIIIGSLYEKSPLLRIPLWYIGILIIKEIAQATITSLAYLKTNQVVPHLQISRIATFSKAAFYFSLRSAYLARISVSPKIPHYGYITAAALDSVVLLAYLQKTLKMITQNTH